MDNALYREEILEHYRNPQNFGELVQFNQKEKQVNSFCGDEVEIFLRIQNDKVLDISFIGKGCAISIAASSILTEYVKGKDIKVIKKLSEHDMLQLLNVRVSDARKKCALLGFFVLQDCIKS